MASYKPVIIPSVHLAISEARARYQQVSREAVRRLNEEMNATIQSVSANPERYSVRFANLRRINLKIFLYAFYYFIDEERKQIVFSSFFHVKMNMPYSDTEGPEPTIHEL